MVASHGMVGGIRIPVKERQIRARGGILTLRSNSDRGNGLRLANGSRTLFITGVRCLSVRAMRHLLPKAQQRTETLTSARGRGVPLGRFLYLALGARPRGRSP